MGSSIDVRDVKSAINCLLWTIIGTRQVKWKFLSPLSISIIGGVIWLLFVNRKKLFTCCLQLVKNSSIWGIYEGSCLREKWTKLQARNWGRLNYSQELCMYNCRCQSDALCNYPELRNLHFFQTFLALSRCVRQQSPWNTDRV